jgi:hypothetical protein
MAQKQNDLKYVAVERPWSWFELLFAFLMGMGVGVAVTVVFAAGVAHAGGDARVTWDQATDCTSVTGWELLGAPITLAVPNPAPATASIQMSIANTAPVVCGFGATRTAAVSGVGPTRFWLRAVFGASLKSGESNSVDVSLPLGKPSGLTVVVP